MEFKGSVQYEEDGDDLHLMNCTHDDHKRITARLDSHPFLRLSPLAIRRRRHIDVVKQVLQCLHEPEAQASWKSSSN